MKELNIKIPEEYIIDKENSNLDKGTITFKKKDALPNNWEEYYNSLSEYIKTDINAALSHLSWLPNNIRCKYIALFKLELLRDVYRQDWKPDYSNSRQDKFNIGRMMTYFELVKCNTTPYFLSFQSKEIRDKFYDNFQYLIAKAEDLV
jgi:hypothetical protein